MKQLAGRVGYADKGNYSPTETYDYLDVVYYNGSSYVAKKLTTGNTPESDSEYWHVFATGSVITGVKGNAETTYRTGDVNLTAEDVGAFALPILLTNQDLNNYYGKDKVGFYYAVGGNSVKNKPYDTYFGLSVERIASHAFRQVFFSGRNNTVYSRFVNDDGTTEPWMELVQQVKGARETAYRGGNVNLTAANIGAVPDYNSSIVVNSTDWDTVTSLGTHAVQNATMDDNHHAPTGMYNFGCLLVLFAESQTDANGTKEKVQIYISDINGTNPQHATMAIRYFYNDAWRSWQYIYNKYHDDATYVKKSGTTSFKLGVENGLLYYEEV